MSEPLLKKNFHSHTFRCGHARGTDEEYIQAAIEKGFQVYGVSDHVMLPGASQPNMRGDFSLFPGYIESIRNLQRKYEGQIKIYLGFEAEYYGDRYMPYYQSLLKEKKIDYLLLGQHCFIDNDSFYWYGSIPNPLQAMEDYAKDLIEGMSTGIFSYVCHPDMFRFFYSSWDSHAIDVATRICKASLKYDVPLEVNMGQLYGNCLRHVEPLSKDLKYPYSKFWDLASKMGCKCIIGVDNHSPQALRDNAYDWVIEFTKEHKLNIIDSLPFETKKE